MTAYYAILEKDDDTLWSVNFPDLPGCISAGETDDEAVQNAVLALRDWMETQAEGVTIPAPSSIEALRARTDIEPGLSIIRVPVTAKSGRAVRVNVTIDETMLSAIDEAAMRRGMSRSAFLASAAETELRRAM